VIYICLALIYLAWKLFKPARRDPMAGRLTHRSPQLHAEIVALHKAEHERIVNGAWKANWK
jgi:hypothetical protein